MTSTEDVVRAATTAYGETVTEIRPLDLTRPAAGTRPPRSRRLPAWVAPVTAAAAVIALAVSLVLVRDIPNGRVVSPEPTATADGGIPRYYAFTIPAANDLWSDLMIGDVSTGARLATIAPPSGSTFVNVTGAADDKTFVADTMPIRSNNDSSPVALTWYLVRISPGSAAGYQMSRLSLPDMRSWILQGVALSASGTQLAMALAPAQPGLPARVLRIYSVTTGKLLRTWATTDTAAFASPAVTLLGMAAHTPLYWVDDDRALAFPTERGPLPDTQGTAGLPAERLLDVTAPGSDLIADSRVIWSEPAGQATGSSCAQEESLLVTPDAKTIVCGAVSRVPLGGTGNNIRQRVTVRWLAYSLATKRTRTLYEVTGQTPAMDGSLVGVLWASPSGDTIIVSADYAKNSVATVSLGVVSHGKFTPLPSVPSFVWMPGPAW